MYNKKLLLTVLKDLNKAKKPTKKKDINYDATGKGMLNKNYAGKPVRLATDTLYNPTPYKINAKSDNGIEQTLEPYDETNVNFPGANYIDEYPEMKKGGGFSRNLLATNRLFKKNTLFKKNQLIKPNKLFKKKSYKRKTYDPLSMYFQDGGEPKYNNLSPTYLAALQNFVYPNVAEDPERTGYNAVNNTINYDSQSPIENMSNDWWREHELFHDLQNQAGGMSTSGVVGQRPNPYVASDESMQGYYDRRDADVNRTIDSMIAENPDLQFIPRDKLAEGAGPGFIGAEDLQYADPSTLEGEARQYEQYIREGNPSIFPKKKKGGENKTKLNKEEEKQFQKFYKTLPENLQTDDDTYDIRGYWDALGRPQEFDYTQPTEADGYYHGFSINPNTGEYLKSPAHDTFQHAVDEDRKIGYRPIPNVYGRNIATYNESIADPEQQTFLRNTEGPANYIETELTPEEIEQYKKGGYIVEDISIPSLNKFAPGGANKGCPPGQYWNGKKCTKLITLKDDKKYIDGVANWGMHVSDPNMVSGDYNDQIKNRLYSGKWGLDPESGALVNLSAIQPQSVTTLDAKTKASREKEKLKEQHHYAEEENKKAYDKSITDAGFDPATFGKAKGVNTITGEPIYASSKEEADRINQEAINQAAIEGHAAVVNNPVFKAGAYMTPVGMAIGAMEGLARFVPDAATFAQDPTLANAGQLGMDVAQVLPFAKPIATATGKAFNYVKNLEPAAPGPMMLMGRFADDVAKTGDDVAKVVSKAETPKSNFKSEIDWENWVKNKEDVVNNPDIIKELNTIEETTKANGTWMKNSDGTPFKGSPEQFVVQQSSRYKAAYPEGTDVVHRGIHKNSAPISGTEESSVIFTGDAPTAAQYIGHIDDVKRPLIKGLNENPLESPQNIITKYYDDAKNWTNQDPAETIQKEIFDAGKNLDDEVLGLYTPKTDNKIIIEGAESPGFNRAFNRLNVEKEFGLNNNSLGQKEELQKFTNWMKENFPDRNLSDNVMTDHFAKYLNEGNSGLQRVDFNNITDPNILGNVQAMKVGPGNYLKSIRGNILFDMNNPDIYKAIIPTVGVTGLTGMMMNDSNGLQQQQYGGGLDRFVKGGYIGEEVNNPSIPALNRFDNGGSPKSQWIAPAQRYSGNSNVDPTTGLIYKDFGDVDVKAGKKGFKRKVQDFFRKDIGKLTKEAEDLGKGIGYIAGVQGDIEPAVYNREGIKKFKSEVKRLKGDFNTELKDAEKKRKQESDNKAEYDKWKKKLDDGDISASEFLLKGKGKNWEAYNDVTVAKGTGPGADYSATDARKEWGDSDQWNKFTGLVSNVATAIPLLGAAGAAGTAGAALLENPVVQGGLTAYGAYDATTNTIPEAYKDFSEGRYLEGAGNVALAGLDLVPGVGLAGKGAKLAGKGLGKIGTKLDQAIYPTRAYRSEALTGNTGFGEQSELAKKVFEKGDWATKSPKEAFHYLKGSEYADESTGLLGGQDMKFTEYKIPFWKKDVSFDPDVVELKKLQGEKINTNEFIVPNKTALDRFLYPSRSTTIKAVPENVKAELTPTQFAPEGVPLYYPGSMPAGTTSDLYASPAYKYVEDQLNAVTGHELPITHQYGSGNYPIKNYVEPQFAPNEGLGKFTRFSSSSPGKGLDLKKIKLPAIGNKAKNAEVPTLSDQTYRSAEIERFNPKTKQYELYSVELPTKIIPGREYADVKHKMSNLKKDLGINMVTDAINKFIPGASHPIGMAKDSGLVIDPKTGKLFDSNTRYWLNREYGYTPDINELLAPMSSSIAENYGKLIKTSDVPLLSKPGINYLDEVPLKQYGGALSKFIGGGSPCDDGYTYDPKLGCIPLSEENMTEDQKWMVEWYKNRKIDFPEDQPSFKKVVEKVLPAYNPESPMLEQMQSFPVYETMPEEYMQENIGGFPAAGMYDPSGKVPKIYFNPQLTPEQKSDTERHELTNYLMEPVKDKLYPMYNKIVEENIIPFDENWPKEKQDFYDYVIDPEEQNIQSYLNVARKKFNLKADEVITPERLNQMREEAEKKGMLDKDNKNFNQDIYLLFKMAKDDEGLMKWFNLIAKKDSNKDDIQYGKYGGSLGYQLGDEIDEATMNELKKLGYTFEEL